MCAGTRCSLFPLGAGTGPGFQDGPEFEDHADSSRFSEVASHHGYKPSASAGTLRGGSTVWSGALLARTTSAYGHYGSLRGVERSYLICVTEAYSGADDRDFYRLEVAPLFICR